MATYLVQNTSGSADTFALVLTGGTLELADDEQGQIETVDFDALPAADQAKLTILRTTQTRSTRRVIGPVLFMDDADTNTTAKSFYAADSDRTAVQVTASAAGAGTVDISGSVDGVGYELIEQVTLGANSVHIVQAPANSVYQRIQIDPDNMSGGTIDVHILKVVEQGL